MVHFFTGLAALVLGLCGIVVWWGEFGEFLRGAIPMLLVLVGLAAIGAGIKSHLSETEFEESEESDDAAVPDRAD